MDNSTLTGHIRGLNNETAKIVCGKMARVKAMFVQEFHTSGNKVRFLGFLIQQREFRLLWLNLWSFRFRQWRLQRRVCGHPN